MKIKILRNKNVFCKIINNKEKHEMLVCKPNSKISFKLKFNKPLDFNKIELIELERILDCLNELDLVRKEAKSK